MSQQPASLSRFIFGLSMFIAGAVSGSALSVALTPATPHTVTAVPTTTAPSRTLPLLQVTPSSSMPQSAGTPPITPARP